jgi:hypothetical protein
MMDMNRLRKAVAMGLLASLLSLVGCDPQRIAELEEGVSTEADVKQRFGEPEKVWEGPELGQPAGTRVLEYSRQPMGHKNYQISIGPDGKMSALRQTLTAANFAKVQPGMAADEVRKLLGRPMKVTPYDLKAETHWDWRWLDGTNPSDSKIFTAVLDSATQRVRSTAQARDPELDPNR